MKIDSTSIYLDTDRVVLWQYDRSPTLLSLFSVMKSVTDATFTDFLNNFKDFVMQISNIGTSGNIETSAALTIWGIVTGFPRPNVTIDGVTRPISDELYKRLLSARLHQMYSPGTLDAVETFISEVFGNSVYVIDNNDMTIGIVQVGDLPEEEQALIGSTESILEILELPIGVGISISGEQETGQFGLNKTESEGQNLENFAETQSSDNGGSLS